MPLPATCRSWLNRLLARHARFRDPRRTIHLVEDAEEHGNEEDGAEDTDAGNRVGAAVEYLRHRSNSAERVGRVTRDGDAGRSAKLL
jgi:hypothetical protein